MTLPELSGPAVCSRLQPTESDPQAYPPSVTVHESGCRLQGRGATMSIGMYQRRPSVGPKVQLRSDAVVGPACSAALGPVRSAARRVARPGA